MASTVCGTCNAKESLPPALPLKWDRCRAYLPNKGRYCRQSPIPDGLYCGNHHYEYHNNNNHNNNNNNNHKRRRIQCPIDPSHSIFADAVTRHCKVCPFLKKKRDAEAQPFYKENANCGGHGRLPTQQTDRVLTGKEAQQLAIRIMSVYQRLVSSRNGMTHGKAATDVTLSDMHQSIPLEDFSDSELQQQLTPAVDNSSKKKHEDDASNDNNNNNNKETGLAWAVSKNRIRTGGQRHLHQQASVVGHLRAMGILQPHAPATTLVELGAGRGMTGLVVGGVAAGLGIATRLILVERQGTRGKADTVLRNAVSPTVSHYPFDLKAIEWSRVQCDIAHLDMSTILEKQQQSEDRNKVENDGCTVAIAKHLCGAGTDLALKSLAQSKHCFEACVFATCCHGVCTWKDYVGRDYLRAEMTRNVADQEFGFSEFELMRRWAAGTVLDSSPVENSDPPEHCHPKLNESDPFGVQSICSDLQLACGPHGLGRACQRLIDLGRLDYMKQVLFPNGTSQLKMVHYVPDSVTPQNALLVARRQTSSYCR